MGNSGEWGRFIRKISFGASLSFAETSSIIKALNLASLPIGFLKLDEKFKKSKRYNYMS